MALIDTLLKGTVSPEQQTIIEMIIHESVALHVDPALAVSVAILESGLNPRAIGDNYTSFGLYQLHQGGELGSMSHEDAFNPVFNTRTALPYFLSVKNKHPDASPGQIAAHAQRPKYPQIYEYTVNLMMPMVQKLMTNLGIYDAKH